VGSARPAGTTTDNHNNGIRKAEAWRNSPAYAEMQRDQAKRDNEKMLKDHEKRMKKQAACEREKATGKIEGFLPACW